MPQMKIQAGSKEENLEFITNGPNRENKSFFFKLEND